MMPENIPYTAFPLILRPETREKIARHYGVTVEELTTEHVHRLIARGFAVILSRIEPPKNAITIKAFDESDLSIQIENACEVDGNEVKPCVLIFDATDSKIVPGFEMPLQVPDDLGYVDATASLDWVERHRIDGRDRMFVGVRVE